MTLLAAHELACGHAGRAILTGTHLDIRPGELVGIVGPNGAGKSTLVKTLAGLLPPLGGAVNLLGRDLRGYKPLELARVRAYMSQTLPPDEGFSVREVVAMGRFPYQRGWGFGDAAGRLAITRALEATGLVALMHEPMSRLSGGQRQRTYLARALAQDAPLILLDEPTAHLDLGHQIEFFKGVLEAIAERSVAVVAVLHDLNLAAQFCHRLCVVAPGDGETPGRLAADGPPDAVLLPELIERVFGLAVEVRHHPRTGVPYLVPLAAAHPAGGGGAHLHVIAGGGAGERLIPLLYRRGYHVTVGALNQLDSDLALALGLGLPTVTEAPFSPLSGETLSGLVAMLQGARWVVVADVAWGVGNVDNLRVLSAHVDPRTVWLVEETPLATRDFTGGEATALVADLLARGARTASLDGVLAALTPPAFAST